MNSWDSSNYAMLASCGKSCFPSQPPWQLPDAREFFLAGAFQNAEHFLFPHD